MLQILPIAIPQVKAGNYQKAYWIESTKSYVVWKRNCLKEITKTIYKIKNKYSRLFWLLKYINQWMTVLQ